MGMTGEQAYVLAKKLIEAGGGGGGTVDVALREQVSELKEDLGELSDKFVVSTQLIDTSKNYYPNLIWKGSSGQSSSTTDALIITLKKGTYICNAKPDFCYTYFNDVAEPLAFDGFYVVNKLQLAHSVFTLTEETPLLLTLDKQYGTPFLTESYEKLPIINTGVIPFGDIFAVTNKKQKPFKGLKYYSFGDSITWYDGQLYGSDTKLSGRSCTGYQSYIADKYGFEHTNFGISGINANRMRTEILSKDFSDVFLVTIMIGTNDFRDRRSVEDYKQDLLYSIQHIMRQNKLCKIVLLSNIYGKILSPVGSDNYVGEIDDSFVNGMKEIASTYSLYFIDCYHNIGFNTFNIENYTVDTRLHYLHPTNEAYRIIGNYICNRLDDVLCSNYLTFELN